MKSLRILAIGAALIAGGSALASAQPNDHRDGRDDRGSNRRFNSGNFSRGKDGGNNFNRGGDRDNRGGNNFVRRNDRDDHRFQGSRPNGIYWRDNDGGRRFVDRDRVVVVRPTYFVGERRFFNGYDWTWDGDRWCRYNHGVAFYFSF